MLKEISLCFLDRMQQDILRPDHINYSRIITERIHTFQRERNKREIVKADEVEVSQYSDTEE